MRISWARSQTGQESLDPCRHTHSGQVVSGSRGTGFVLERSLAMCRAISRFVGGLIRFMRGLYRKRSRSQATIFLFFSAGDGTGLGGVFTLEQSSLCHGLGFAPAHPGEGLRCLVHVHILLTETCSVNPFLKRYIALSGTVRVYSDHQDLRNRDAP